MGEGGVPGAGGSLRSSAGKMGQLGRGTGQVCAEGDTGASWGRPGWRWEVAGHESPGEERNSRKRGPPWIRAPLPLGGWGPPSLCPCVLSAVSGDQHKVRGAGARGGRVTGLKAELEFEGPWAATGTQSNGSMR